MWLIFSQFFILGCLSFGGPAAHIGYFRKTFVEKLLWLTEKEYADLVALSQFLPGPGSSQVGFSIGYLQGGFLGGVTAFIAFTLPSFLLVLSVAATSALFVEHDLFEVIIHSLKLLAVVVVFDAVLSMYKSFCHSFKTVLLCFISAACLLIFPSLLSQVMVIIGAALFGYFYIKTNEPKVDKSRLAFNKTAYAALFLFLIGLLLIPAVSFISAKLQVFSDFFQAGSMVFGGGHVVLPLLQNIVSEQLSADQFLTGYAVAQAVPGPMFSLASYLGYFMLPTVPILGALLATIAIFLPGFLLLLIFLKNWQVLAAKPTLSAAITGVNAAVVGLLISALYQPVFVSAVESSVDMALVLIGALLLSVYKVSVLKLIAFFLSTGLLLYFL